jgi:para-aminobenzoate synthetase component 1
LKKTTSTHCSFAINDFEQVKEKVLNWVHRFNTFCFLDNHQYQLAPHSLECLLAAGVKRELKVAAGDALVQLQEFIDEGTKRDGPAPWLFGHLGYDLKNEIEALSSGHPDPVRFPDLYFFEPEIVIRLTPQELIIEAADPGSVFTAIQHTAVAAAGLLNAVTVQSRFSEQEYLAVIRKLKEHILRGDCYEINFCQEFYSEKAIIDPVDTYKKLSTVSPNPFSALYRLHDQWLLCASPERFIRREGGRILSQPIKGTSKRYTGNPAMDERSKEELWNSPKDRSENVMVVDLVRNDLAKVCEEGTVKVDELYGIYSFPQVHQMISTISGELKKDISFTAIIQASFPMGSMTGAPKKRVMELIEAYEKTKRGIFSGAVGYIAPNGDFDLNVVIRSIFYNDQTKYLSYLVGSGITFYSDPEKEWEECLLKAEAIRKVLQEEKG